MTEIAYRSANRLQSILCTLLLCVAPTLAVAGDISIYQQTDKFDGQTLYFTKREQPKIEGGSFFSERYIYFNFTALSPVIDPRVAYGITIEVNAPSWMFIPTGESLVLKADGNRVSLSGRGSAADREVVYGGIQETAYYAFPLETLQQLAAAKTIEFRIYGDKNQVTGTFTEPMMQELRYFLQEAPRLIGAAVPGSSSSLGQQSPGQVAVPQTPLRLGASFMALPEPLAKTLSLEPGHGLLVIAVAPDLPAARGGIKAGDVITSFDGVRTDKPEALQAAVSAHSNGKPALLTVVTPGQTQRQVSLDF